MTKTENIQPTNYDEIQDMIDGNQEQSILDLKRKHSALVKEVDILKTRVLAAEQHLNLLMGERK